MCFFILRIYKSYKNRLNNLENPPRSLPIPRKILSLNKIISPKMQHKNDSSYDFYHHKAITLARSPQDKTNNQPQNQIVSDLLIFHIFRVKNNILRTAASVGYLFF